MQVFVLLFVAILPFFEGCESAVGLFLLHTAALVAVVAVCLRIDRIHFPPFAAFVPFLFYLFLSCLIAPYKYSALLQLWDWWYAAVLAFVLLQILRNSPPDELDHTVFRSFVVGAAALAASVILSWQGDKTRWSGSFVNPNDFGTYCVLLLLLGIFQLEHLASPRRKRIVWAALAFLSVCIAMASSRSIFLACLAGTAYYIWERRPSRWILFSMTAFIGFISVMLAWRLAYQTDPFQYYRLKIWKYSLQGILNDPYLGIGLNMLPWKAAQFNFPATTEVGRFARVATSADNEYLQILAETGFLGFFLFLIGWVGVFLLLRRIPRRFHILRYPPFIVLSIIALFSLPLNNTAITSLFLYLLLIPIAASGEVVLQKTAVARVVRVLIPVLALALFLFAVLLPFAADREFLLARRATSGTEAEAHLRAAIRLNPYQPYYRFYPIRSVVASSPKMEPEKWLRTLASLNTCIQLNPLDANFYIYRAKIFRILYQQTHEQKYYSEAINSYLSAQEHSPYQVFQRAEFAFFLISTGRVREGEDQIEQILKLEPAFMSARLLQIQVQLEEGDLEKARILMQDFEERVTRYTPYASVAEPYVAKLLQFDREQKDKLKKLIELNESR